jgi:hypothetical protein
VGGEHLLLLHFLVIGPSIISCLGCHLENLKLKIEDQHKALLADRQQHDETAPWERTEISSAVYSSKFFGQASPRPRKDRF